MLSLIAVETKDRRVLLRAEQAMALAERKLILPGPNGAFVTTDTVDQLLSKLPNPICDFCASATPVKRYSAATFTCEHDPNTRSYEDWYACPVCAVMIDADNYNDLAEYCFRCFGARDGLDRETAMPMLKALHQQFRQNRTTELAE